MNRSCHFKPGSKPICIKSKIIITKSFLSKNREPKDYTVRSFLSEFRIFIHIYICKSPVWRLCDGEILTIQKHCMGSDCKWNKSYLLNISMGYKDNDLVNFDPKNNKGKH